MLLLSNTWKYNDKLQWINFDHQNKGKYVILYLSYFSIKIKKLDKNITITDTQVDIVAI